MRCALHAQARIERDPEVLASDAVFEGVNPVPRGAGPRVPLLLARGDAGLAAHAFVEVDHHRVAHGSAPPLRCDHRDEGRPHARRPADRVDRVVVDQDRVVPPASVGPAEARRPVPEAVDHVDTALWHPFGDAKGQGSRLATRIVPHDDQRAVREAELGSVPGVDPERVRGIEVGQDGVVLRAPEGVQGAAAVEQAKLPRGRQRLGPVGGQGVETGLGQTLAPKLHLSRRGLEGERLARGEVERRLALLPDDSPSSEAGSEVPLPARRVSRYSSKVAKAK